MNRTFKIITLISLLIAPLVSLSQKSDPDLRPAYEERPQYMPFGGKHRNLRDEYERKIGTWKFYSYTHTLIAEINYSHDVKHGMATIYFPHNGTVKEVAEYFEGKKDGEYRLYYYSGDIKIEGFYSYGKRHGKWTYYHIVTGEMKSEGRYNKGFKTGEWKHYNAKGELVDTYVYGDAGLLIMQNGMPVNHDDLKQQDKEVKESQESLQKRFQQQNQQIQKSNNIPH